MSDDNGVAGWRAGAVDHLDRATSVLRPQDGLGSGRRHQGPLEGLRGVVLAGQGPGPFATMLLADLGADIIRVDRVAAVDLPPSPDNILGRGCRSVAVDIRSDRGGSIVRQLAEGADFLVEGFRPGVLERFGLGPGPLLALNRGLVYARMTGWGQDGPYAQNPGHDINYIATTGVLNAIGPAGGKPIPPLNLVGDYGGGGMLLVVGILSGLLERMKSGTGQVIDVSMLDGSLLLATQFFGLTAAGMWSNRRGSNSLDGGLPFYDVYAAADGYYVSVAALEPQFLDDLLAALNLKHHFEDPYDEGCWPEMRQQFRAVFATQTREYWARLGIERRLCLSPVRSFEEVQNDPHVAVRGCLTELDGVVQPEAAPRFSRTPCFARVPAPRAGEHTMEVLSSCGMSAEAIAQLADEGVVGVDKWPGQR